MRNELTRLGRCCNMDDNKILDNEPAYLLLKFYFLKQLEC